jgi:hypothetical protein
MNDLVGHVLLEHLQGYGESAALGFAYQQVYLFGHDHLADYAQPVPFPHLFKGLFESVACVRSPQ